MYHANEIANYILCYYNKKGVWISNLKLQKVLYFLQAQFLARRDIPLYIEPILAFDFGPVVENVYHLYKIFGSAPIPVNDETKYHYSINSDDRYFVDWILDGLKDKPSSELLKFIHKQKPWKEAYNRGNGYPISDYILRDYFCE